MAVEVVRLLDLRGHRIAHRFLKMQLTFYGGRVSSDQRRQRPMQPASTALVVKHAVRLSRYRFGDWN